MSHDRISRDPSILMGKPCIKGTRISVETVVRRLAAGLSAEQIAAEYPELTREDVLAAAAYAADLLRHDGLVAAE
ncbi:MAG: antitoxin [Proteobacteria bacterium HN_bin10]|nr:MAG: antitoxin [Proteobacteria bacterium HN_bin10]